MLLSLAIYKYWYLFLPDIKFTEFEKVGSTDFSSDTVMLFTSLFFDGLASLFFFSNETLVAAPWPFRLIDDGALANKSRGCSSLINFHQPLSFKVVSPERNITPLQCDIVPEIVPSHVFLFFICGPNKVIQFFSRNAATCNFQ